MKFLVKLIYCVVIFMFVISIGSLFIGFTLNVLSDIQLFNSLKSYLIIPNILFLASIVIIALFLGLLGVISLIRRYMGYNSLIFRSLMLEKRLKRFCYLKMPLEIQNQSDLNNVHQRYKIIKPTYDVYMTHYSLVIRVKKMNDVYLSEELENLLPKIRSFVVQEYMNRYPLAMSEFDYVSDEKNYILKLSKQ